MSQLPTIKKWGIPVLKELDEYKTVAKPEDFKNLLENLPMTRRDISLSKINADTMSINTAGYIVVDKMAAPLRLTNYSFEQLAQILGLPKSIANRIGSRQLVILINSLLENFGQALYMRRAGQIVVGLSLTNNFYSCYNICHSIDFNEIPAATFAFAGYDNHCWSIMFIYGEKKTEGSMGGFELLLSDNGSIRPTISAVVLNAKGHAILTSLSFKTPKNATEEDGLFWSSIKGSIAEIKVRVQPFVEKYDRIEKTAIDAGNVAALMEKANRDLKQPLAINDSKTYGNVFDKLLELKRNRKANSLLERRESAIFYGHVLSIMK